MYISKHWSTEPIQRHFIHLQLAFCYLHALFMRSNYNGIRPKTRTCSCRNSQSRWWRTVHFVVDFHVKSAYNSKTNLFTRKTLQCSGPIFKKKSLLRNLLLSCSFFFGDAIVSFNEIIALINKRKWVWNEYEMELLLSFLF